MNSDEWAHAVDKASYHPNMRARTSPSSRRFTLDGAWTTSTRARQQYMVTRGNKRII
jgi:hypothetical protein